MFHCEVLSRTSWPSLPGIFLLLILKCGYPQGSLYCFLFIYFSFDNLVASITASMPITRGMFKPRLFKFKSHPQPPGRLFHLIFPLVPQTQYMANIKKNLHSQSALLPASPVLGNSITPTSVSSWSPLSCVSTSG